jgi:dTDP-4-dehydrorhamnose 3,5-epimerase
MAIRIAQTELPGVLEIETDVYPDARGFFKELHHRKRYAEAGLDRTFVQDSFSRSTRGVLRGLHYQLRNPQGKLLAVLRGEIYDVAVDIRRGSPTFGRWVGVRLSDANGRQLFVPEGFAHGFCALSETADVLYKNTALYTPGDEFGVRWSDPRLAIAWPVAAPVLSPRDAALPTLAEVAPANLPQYA